MSKYNVEVGEEFELEISEVGKGRFDQRVSNTGQIRETTRGWVAQAIIITILLFLVAAGIHGLLAGTFGALQSVWTACGAPLGAVLGHYFSPHGRDE